MASWPSCSTNGQKYCFWLYFGYHGKILKDLKFFKESRTCSWFLELQYFQIRVGWWWVINTTLQNCGSNRWTSTHFSNSKDTCTKRQITFGRFQSSSNPWTSKDFRSVLKAYIRPLVLIIRHWKIFRCDIEREKVKYPFKRKPCNWESPKLSKFYL